jgi:hypothetical protein
VPVCTFSRPTTVGEADDALCDELRVLDQVGGVADHTRHQHLAVRQLDVFPDAVLVLVAHVRRLDGVALRALIFMARSAMYFSSMSVTCGRWPLPQQKWKRICSSGMPSVEWLMIPPPEAEVLAQVLLDAPVRVEVQVVANSGSSICTMRPASVMILYSSRTASATAVMYSSSEP